MMKSRALLFSVSLLVACDQNLDKALPEGGEAVARSLSEVAQSSVAETAELARWRSQILEGALRTRRVAAEEASYFTNAEAAALPALWKAVREADPVVRHWAIEAIEDITLQNRAASMNEIVALRKVEDDFVRAVAERMIVSTSPAESPGRPPASNANELSRATAKPPSPPSAPSPLVVAGRPEAEWREWVKRMPSIRMGGPSRLLNGAIVMQRVPGGDWESKGQASPELLEKDRKRRQSALDLKEKRRVQAAAQKRIALAIQAGPDGVDEIFAFLEDPDRSIRNWAAGALARIGPDLVPRIPELAYFLDTRTGPSVRQICDALIKLGPEAEPAVPALIRLTASNEEQPVLSAMRTLIKIGPAAADAMPALREKMQGTEGEMRLVAAIALSAIGRDSSALPVLLHALEHGEEPAKGGALNGIRHLGPIAAEAAPLIFKHYQGIPSGLQLAISALASIGPDALPTIELAAGHPDRNVSKLAQGVLARFYKTSLAEFTHD